MAGTAKLIIEDHFPPQVSHDDGDLEQVCFFLGRAYYTYIGLLDRLLAEMGLDEHLRPGMGNVLFALFERDDQTISEIADRLRVSKSTMTGTVRRIKQAGLITTRRDRNDGRAVRLKLTALGRSLEPCCRELARRIDGVVCRKFSDKQRAELKEMLAAMIESMNEELEDLNGE